MAFEEFVIEGEATLGYFGDQVDDRHVRIKTDGDSEESLGARVEQTIARALNFPNSDEFDAFFQKMDALRQKDLQPADGTPDVIRDGFKLRIRVEVVEEQGLYEPGIHGMIKV